MVAVFVQGAQWQFRDFPFKARPLARRVTCSSLPHCCARPSVQQGAAEGNLVTTFDRVQAFFVRYDSEPVPDFVKKWSVRTMELSKNTRHSDRSVVEGFWQAVDHWLQMKRSTLKF